jgi:hypothetical protein
MTQLKSTPGSQVNEVCDLLGYYQPGDGGGGQFYWDPNSTLPGNDGTVVQLSQGRWIRIADEPANVKWFGVKEDTESPDLTDNTNRLQRCIDNCNSIMFKPGVYTVNDTLHLESNQHIDLNGSALKFVNSTPDKALFRIQQKINIILTNGSLFDNTVHTSTAIFIIGDPLATTPPIAANKYASDILIDRITIQNFKKSVTAENATRRINIVNSMFYTQNGVEYRGKTVENVIDGSVIYCSQSVAGCYGVGLFGRSEAAVLYPEGLTITNCTIDAFYNSFHVENIYTLQVSNNYLGANTTNGNATFYFTKGVASHCEEILIDNNLIYAKGIVFTPNTTSPQLYRAIVSNCIFVVQSGVSVLMNNFAGYIGIKGCRFEAANTNTTNIAIVANNNNLNLTVSDIEIDATYTTPIQVKGSGSQNSSISNVTYRGTSNLLYLEQPVLLSAVRCNTQGDVDYLYKNQNITGTTSAGQKIAGLTKHFAKGERGFIVVSGYATLTSAYAILQVTTPTGVKLASGTGWASNFIMLHNSQHLSVCIPYYVLDHVTGEIALTNFQDTVGTIAFDYHSYFGVTQG